MVASVGGGGDGGDIEEEEDSPRPLARSKTLHSGGNGSVDQRLLAHAPRVLGTPEEGENGMHAVEDVDQFWFVGVVGLDP